MFDTPMECLLTVRQDVFLTTMKPQQKVVTAQDIESSLYYIHVDSEEDLELLRSEEDDHTVLSEEEHMDIEPVPAQVGRDAIHRKPLLPPRRPVQGLQNELPSRPNLLHPPRNGEVVSWQAGRKPVGQGSSSSHQKSGRGSSMFAHQPVLGPRPMRDRHQPIGSTPLADVSERQNVDSRRWSEQPVSSRPQLPPRPYERKSRELDELYRANLIYSNDKGLLAENGRSSRYGDSYSTPSGQSPASELCLTLIRRYDGVQNNVGRILAGKSSGGPLALELMGSGYYKFNADSDSSLKTASLEEQEQAVYRCQLESIAIPSRPNHGLRTDSHDSHVAHRPGFRESLDLRRRSHMSSDGFQQSSNPRSASAKGYSFQSPWNGSCNFVTGVAGRSLKCLHSHPSNYGQAIEISELRFNLPSSKTFAAAPKSLSPGTSRESKRSSFFSNSHRRHDSFDSINGGSSETKVDLEERLDLSLGQEHAGGGFGGKHAKLGKLIIEPGGLQMLDLVVSANMALWWRVYDRMV